VRGDGQRRRLGGQLRGPSRPTGCHPPSIGKRVRHGSGAARRRDFYSVGGGGGHGVRLEYTHSHNRHLTQPLPSQGKTGPKGPRGPAPGTKGVSKRGTGCSRTLLPKGSRLRGLEPSQRHFKVTVITSSCSQYKVSVDETPPQVQTEFSLRPHTNQRYPFSQAIFLTWSYCHFWKYIFVIIFCFIL
jgi:hypothetical protein